MKKIKDAAAHRRADHLALLSAIESSYGAVPCVSSEGEDWLTEEFRASAAAALACASCPLLEQCRTYALQHQEEEGTWGGMTADDRRRRRRRARHKYSRSRKATDSPETAPTPRHGKQGAGTRTKPTPQAGGVKKLSQTPREARVDNSAHTSTILEIALEGVNRK